MLIKERKNNSYVAKNDDTGEKRKSYQRNTIILIYRFHNLQRQYAGTHCFIAFFNYPKFSTE